MNRAHSCSLLFPAAAEERNFNCSAWHFTKEEHTLSVVNLPFYCPKVARRERCHMQAFSLSVSADYFTHMVKWFENLGLNCIAKNLRRDLWTWRNACRSFLHTATEDVSDRRSMMRCTRYNWRNGCSSAPITQPRPTLSSPSWLSRRLLAAPH